MRSGSRRREIEFSLDKREEASPFLRDPFGEPGHEDREAPCDDLALVERPKAPVVAQIDERHNDGPGMGFDVANQTAMTGGDGPSRWRTVGWTAGDRVGDEEVPFEESRLGDCPPEDITGSAPKRLFLDDLRRARGLTDEDEAARGVAAWADGHAEAVRAAEAWVDGRHGASVSRPCGWFCVVAPVGYLALRRACGTWVLSALHRNAGVTRCRAARSGSSDRTAD